MTQGPAAVLIEQVRLRLMGEVRCCVKGRDAALGNTKRAKGAMNFQMGREWRRW